MKVRVLGCSGAIAKNCRTTSFLLDRDVLIDAGTGVGDLTLEEMRDIDHVVLTHSHLDHVAALPLMVDSVGALRTRPLQVHGLPETVDALKAHIFNDVIWPDFSRIPTPDQPFIQFNVMAVGDVLQFGDKAVEVLPAVHSVPAVGIAATGGKGYWVFSGDTGPNPAFWARVNQLPVTALVIETAFSNREHRLAQLSLHLSPAMLAEEIANIAGDRRFPIYITHTKPAATELIMQEIEVFNQQDGGDQAGLYDIRWLRAGKEFNL